MFCFMVSDRFWIIMMGKSWVMEGTHSISLQEAWSYEAAAQLAFDFLFSPEPQPME